MQTFYKPQATHDVTQTKNLFSNLSQSVMSPHHDLTIERVQY
jgi:hypothetical protein